MSVGNVEVLVVAGVVEENRDELKSDEDNVNSSEKWHVWGRCGCDEGEKRCERDW